MMTQALLFRSGAGTSFPCEAAAFTRTRPRLQRPDIQWYFIPGSGLQALRWPGLKSGDPLDREAFTIGWAQLRPRSRGHVLIVSRDINDAPQISSGYLSHAEDMRVMIDAFRQVRLVASQAAFAPFIEGELSPGVAVNSDEDIASFVRATISSGKHPSGTCRMGVDSQAVVDPQLRVHGVSGLRVIDASIMPTVISGGLNAPTIMIAEKGAELTLGRRAWG